jgi:LPXTG-motif cell wall-anchored protein
VITLSNPTVSINASDIVSKLSSDLVISAGSILVNATILSSTGSDLTLKASGNINVNGTVGITTQGGDITLWSDSDASGVGSIRLGAETDTSTGTLNSNGGNITLSGGLDPATGFAMASTDKSSSKPTAGVAGYGFNVQAGGGSIVVRGSSLANGILSTRAVLFETNQSATRQVFQTSGSGTISIDGDGGAIGSGNAWGYTAGGITVQTENGAILIRGKGNIAVGNDRGIVSGSATYTSTTGNITFEDYTTGNANFSGTYFGAPNSFSTLGNLTILTDAFQNDSTLTLATAQATIRPYTGSSFATALSILGTIAASNSSGLTIGASGNTLAVTLSTALTVGGPLTIYAGNIALNGAISTPSSNVFLYSTGSVTQSASISSGGLALSGSGTFTLNNSSNNIGTLAGGSAGAMLGSISLTNSNGITIGQVGAGSGLYSSGVINIATNSGNLSILQPVSSTATSGDSVLLFASKPTSVGSAGDGDVIISGSGSVLTEAGARALIYSGSRVTSSGLISQVGGESNARSLVGATTDLSTVSPSIGSTGKFALFRTNTPTPTIPGTPGTPTATAGNGQATVQISPPTSGDDPVSYLVTASPGGATCSITAPAISCTVTGLTNGTAYTFSSTATNAGGTSAASASSNSVTPSTPTPTTAATTAPASTTPAVMLATTGANVEGLMVVGLLAVIAGAGFLTVSRRKRTA